MPLLVVQVIEMLVVPEPLQSPEIVMVCAGAFATQSTRNANKGLAKFFNGLTILTR